MHGMPIGDFSIFCGGANFGMPIQSFAPMWGDGLGGAAGMSNSIWNCPGIENAANQGREFALRMQLSGQINAPIATLSSLENNLQSLLSSDKLDDSQKSQIQNALNKIKAKKEELQNKFKNLDLSKMSFAELQALQQEVQNSANDVQGIQKEVSDLSEQIAKELQKKAEEEAKQAEQQDGEAGGAGSGTGEAGDAGNASGTTTIDGKEVDVKTGRPASLGAAPEKTDIADACLRIRQSITCAGTKHDVLDPIIQSLDASNIIEVVSYWEDNYDTDGGKKYENFFDKIFADVGDDWQSENIPTMRTALAKRAEALGIGAEVEKELAKVDMELTKGPSWKKLWCGSWHDDHKLAEGLMNAYKLIKAKEAKNVTSANIKSDEAKAKEQKAADDVKQDTQKQDQEKINLFIGDMREIWENDALEVSEKVTYKDGKFKIRIKGVDYYGIDFNALVKEIENAGYNPKEYICKK